MAVERIRVGVVGVSRGQSFIHGAAPAGMELVAICDTWEDKLKEVASKLGVAAYTSFDEFLGHEMDAVVLANYFHEHAPLAIKALRAGLHVMSECASCGTLAEGVALVRAVEESGRVYMLAENYPYFAYNQEMRRLYREGRVGKFLYGECEYVHPDPADVRLARSVGWNHWRNWIPATYYCTHSIGAVMYITDTRPVRVNAFVMPYDHDDPTLTMTAARHDIGAVLMLQMDSGAFLKSLHGALRGHQNYTRIHGNKGLMENARTGNTNMLRVRREVFDKDDGEPVDTLYLPDFPEHHAEAMRAGHAGGDFFTNYHFADAIRTGRQPYLDVYRGVQMSIVGIQGWRSALAGGAPLEVPDFRNEEARARYENDDWTPDPAAKCINKPPCSLLGHIELSDRAKAFAREVWARQGWCEITEQD